MPFLVKDRGPDGYRNTGIYRETFGEARAELLRRHPRAAMLEPIEIQKGLRFPFVAEGRHVGAIDFVKRYQIRRFQGRLDYQPVRLECKRCGHRWTPRGARPPKVCPKCKSPYWSKERRKEMEERLRLKHMSPMQRFEMIKATLRVMEAKEASEKANPLTQQ